MARTKHNKLKLPSKKETMELANKDWEESIHRDINFGDSAREMKNEYE